MAIWTPLDGWTSHEHHFPAPLWVLVLLIRTPYIKYLTATGIIIKSIIPSGKEVTANDTWQLNFDAGRDPKRTFWYLKSIHSWDRPRCSFGPLRSLVFCSSTRSFAATAFGHRSGIVHLIESDRVGFVRRHRFSRNSFECYHLLIMSNVPAVSVALVFACFGKWWVFRTRDRDCEVASWRTWSFSSSFIMLRCWTTLILAFWEGQRGIFNSSDYLLLSKQFITLCNRTEYFEASLPALVQYY